MTVKRIVPDFHSTDLVKTKKFYQDVLGLKPVMEQEWIITFASDAMANPQISIISEGGAGAPVPDISVEVDDVNAVHAKATSMGYEIVYELRDEGWGVRRFFVKDPNGKVINVLSHV